MNNDAPACVRYGCTQCRPAVDKLAAECALRLAQLELATARMAHVKANDACTTARAEYTASATQVRDTRIALDRAELALVRLVTGDDTITSVHRIDPNSAAQQQAQARVYAGDRQAYFGQLHASQQAQDLGQLDRFAGTTQR